VNEQCHPFNECAGYSAFLHAGGARDALCASARATRIRSLVLPLQLDDTFRFSCD
jgi:hypothetical protein